MIRNSKQVWEVGCPVKVGFLTLFVVSKEPTPGDYMPDAYILRSLDGSKFYRFVPHNGLERIDAPTFA
jgi:hypothetical protein